MCVCFFFVSAFNFYRFYSMNLSWHSFWIVKWLLCFSIQRISLTVFFISFTAEVNLINNLNTKLLNWYWIIDTTLAHICKLFWVILICGQWKNKQFVTFSNTTCNVIVRCMKVLAFLYQELTMIFNFYVILCNHNRCVLHHFISTLWSTRLQFYHLMLISNWEIVRYHITLFG